MQNVTDVGIPVTWWYFGVPGRLTVVILHHLYSSGVSLVFLFKYVAVLVVWSGFVLPLRRHKNLT